MGAAFLSYGLFVAIYRLSSFPRKIVAYIAACISSAGIFLASALLLVPWLGAYGAATSVCIGFDRDRGAHLPVTARPQSDGDRVSPHRHRIGRGRHMHGPGPGVGPRRDPGNRSWSLWPSLFPAALLLLGVVTGEDRRAIGRLAREACPSGPMIPISRNGSGSCTPARSTRSRWLWCVSGRPPGSQITWEPRSRRRRSAWSRCCGR